MPGAIKYFRKRRILSGGPTAFTFRDPYWNLVGLSLRAKVGAANGTANNTFSDSSPNNFPLTKYGAVGQGSFSPYGDEGTSIYLDGSSDYLMSNSTIGQFGTQNFCFEAWIHPRSYGTNTRILSVDAGGSPQIQTYLNSSGYVYGFVYVGGYVVHISSQVTAPLNTWTHFAFVRNGNTFTLFVNGVSQSTATWTGSIANNNKIWVGTEGSNTSGYNFFGNIADARIVKGSPVYTSNFSVPTAPLTAITNTAFLLSVNPNIVDTTKNSDIETAGPASVSTAVKKFSEGSINLTSSGDYLVVADTQKEMYFGQRDFTIEFWVRFAEFTQYGTVFSIGNYLTGSSSTISMHHNNTANSIGIDAVTTTGSRIYDFDGNKWAPVTNTWYHVAVVRHGTKLRWYVDGLLKNTLEVGTSAFGQQTMHAVLGASQISGEYQSNCYIDDFRVTNGVALYTNEFALEADYAGSQYSAPSGDPYYGNVIRHMHMNGADGSTLIVDQRGSQPAVVGVALSSSVSKFGGTSAYFNGSSRLEFPLVGLKDYTVEMWLYPTGASTGWGPLLRANNAGDYCNTGLPVNGNNIFVQNVITTIPTSSIPLNQWTHFAVSRSGATAYLHLNGTLVWSGACNTDSFDANGMQFGGAHDIGGFGGYIDEVRITQGVARYTSNFTVPDAPFPDYQDFSTDQYLNKTVLLKATKSGNNSTIIDSSPNNFAVTRTGNVTQGTFSPFSNSGWSNYFNGSSYLQFADSPSFALGNNDFTIEGWINSNSNSSGEVVQKKESGAYGPWTILIDGATNGLCLYMSSTGSSWDIASAVKIADVTVGSWIHFAVCRSGNTIRTFANGILKSTRTTSASVVADSHPLLVGNTFNGFISNLRVIKGSALYTGSFTPATSPLTTVTNTQLLTCQSNRFVDNSSNNFALTVNGVPSVQAFSPFAPATYSAATHGGSLYFDGKGDYASTPVSNSFNFGANDFTIEAFFYINGFNTTDGRIIANHNGWGANAFSLHVDHQTQNEKLSFFMYNHSSSQAMLVSTTQLKVKQWYHCAIVRSGTAFSMFLNGVLNATATSNTILNNSDDDIVLSSGASNEWFDGYLSNVRVTKGTALYTSDFTIPNAPLTSVTNTQLLLSGTNSAIVDSTGKVVVETVGSAKTDVANKRYSGSFNFNGTTDCLRIANQPVLQMGAGDFTIEAWIRPNVVSGYQSIVSAWQDGSVGNRQYQFYLNGASIGLDVASGSTAYTNTTVAANIQAGRWTHVAAVRWGTKKMIFVDGILLQTTDIGTIALDNSAYPIGIGASNVGGTPGTYFNGLIEDVRITKGTARYVTNFTIPLKSF